MKLWRTPEGAKRLFPACPLRQRATDTLQIAERPSATAFLSGKRKVFRRHLDRAVLLPLLLTIRVQNCRPPSVLAAPTPTCLSKCRCPFRVKFPSNHRRTERERHKSSNGQCFSAQTMTTGSALPLDLIGFEKGSPAKWGWVATATGINLTHRRASVF